MPRGSRHELTGTLLAHGRLLILCIDDGGEGRLDAPACAWSLVGRRVTVTGTRDDFDLLAVSNMEVCSTKVR